MNEKRTIWSKAHGKIPKGWIVHSLNGDKGDVKLENLAAIPRYPTHQGQITSPYTVRIRELERLLKEQEGEKNVS
jgi:hypothetical protein